MVQERVKFHSANDLSTCWYLQKIETFFLNWHKHICAPDVNTILELFNIKKYLDTGVRLIHWSDQQVCEYFNKGKMIPQIIGRFCDALSSDNLVKVCSTVDAIYSDDFWELIYEYKVFKRISQDTIRHILDLDEFVVWYILSHKKLAMQFGQVIAAHLAKNPYTAEKLMANYLQARAINEKPLFFPSEFTQEMREKALLDYIDSDHGNINYLQLMERSQGTGGLQLSDKLRYKARKKEKRLRKRYLQKAREWSMVRKYPFAQCLMVQ